MNEIIKIINEWDPIGLFPMAPQNEYMPETVEIYKILKYSKLDKQTLAQIINNIFIKKFGDDVYKENIINCEKVASKILELYEYAD